MDPHTFPPLGGDGRMTSGASGRTLHGAAKPAGPTRDCDIRLALPARPENIGLVRHVIGALAEALTLPPRVVEDIRLAVTEACSNVVRHAYRGTDGPIEVMIQPEPGRMTVVVADHGLSILPNPASDGPGLGLPLIAALADALEIEHSPETGSRLSMSFSVSGGALEAA